MTQNKDLKKLVRERMQQTGERYTEALANITKATPLEPVPAPWFMGGERPGNYEFGLLPSSVSYQTARTVRLRSKGSGGTGFGTMMQSFTAGDYRGRRVRLHAQLRSLDVSGWAGMWMRVDDTSSKGAAFDNMRDRALSGTTDWQPAAVVLDVTADATSIHFGVMLTGGGAIDVARLDFEEVDDSVAPTNSPLATGPQGLDFNARF
ncbi:hypothetical protein GCM10009839_43800 [Catenulispora yoronensis]|uniref:Uncharacterized protein n=1 Tax=Catenulispora yoronensis TaxID=450799 RepID=A0ABN2UI66_9ACTN